MSDDEFQKKIRRFGFVLAVPLFFIGLIFVYSKQYLGIYTIVSLFSYVIIVALYSVYIKRKY